MAIALVALSDDWAVHERYCDGQGVGGVAEVSRGLVEAVVRLNQPPAEEDADR